MTLEEKTVVLMRRCGHHLHHNASGKTVDSAELLRALSDEEKETLASLLEKCLNSWGTEEGKKEA